MNIDQLIRDADPAAGITIPGPDSPLARQSLQRRLTARPGRQRAWRRRWVIPIVIGAVAASATAVTLVLPTAPGLPISQAAAGVLYEAAAAARHQKPLVLLPGEYMYADVRAFGYVGVTVKSGKNFLPGYLTTDQSWLNARGSGKEIYTSISPVGFKPGPEGERAWIKAGRPDLWGPDGRKRRVVGTGPGIPLDNLSHLPTSPAALAQAISDHKTGLADINADIEDPSTPEGLFLAASEILSKESVGGTPALRSALFTIMAQQPGIRFLGHATTRSGRIGIGLATSPDSEGNVFKIIVDPASGQVLETDEYTHGTLDNWTEYLATAVVSSIGQLPNSRSKAG